MDANPLDTPAKPSLPQPLLRPKMPELDVIRGIASLAVLFYHGLYHGRSLTPFSVVQRRILFSFSPGQFGVNLFFVLSGFLITGLLLDSRARPDYYRRFYVRRALRILPAYYAVLLILVLTHTTSKSFLAISLFYCANLSLLFGIVMSYPVLWSLAVEEHFYLFWPTVVHRISVRGLAILAAGIVVASPLLRLLCFLHASPAATLESGCFYYTWNNADGLACGALLAVVSRKYAPHYRRLLHWSLACLGFAFALAAIGIPFGILTRQTRVGSALQSVPWNIGFMGIIGLFVIIGASSRKALVTPRALIFFGNISYGLYMVHQLMFIAYDRFVATPVAQSLGHPGLWTGLWIRFALAGTAAVGVAYLSRRFFEEPFLRLKDKLS